MVLKLALLIINNHLQCIASTTLDEFRSQFEKDKALTRRFQPVLIDESSEVCFQARFFYRINQPTPVFLSSLFILTTF